jgi:NAD(P)-dependent dehydrogenase (short-subunit alcohol dehydrogenase family)
MFRLDNRVAVVTGGARGIGKAICQILAKQGARGAVADIKTDLAEQTAAEISAGGGTAMEVYDDVTDLESVRAMARKIHEAF